MIMRIIRSTLYGGITVVLNIVLNAVFIFGFAIFPEMGASDAAAATVIAVGAELLFVLIENSVTDTAECTGFRISEMDADDLAVMWIIIGPLGSIAAFILKWPVPLVYLILNLDECIKVPIAYRHYKKYKWVKNLT